MTKHIPQTILITGASSGLGASLARIYSEKGKKLLITGRNAKRLAEVSAHCQAKGALVESYANCDINDYEKLSEWILSMDAKHKVDLVIANAGISAGTAGGNESYDQIMKVMHTNIDGVINTIYPLIKPMQERKKGQIAIMGSLAGYRGLPSSPTYSASKAAVRIFGEGLRGQLKNDNIGVSLITPGYIKSPMTDVNDFPMPFIVETDKAAKSIKKRLQRNPARIAFPWQLYSVVWFLSCLSPSWTDGLFARLPGKKSLAE
ncbi:MAG: SDR family NAD(P)-dependent oxidoreductase [Rickettsiales bacterium]|nr:SDR family NAD(P)-dependent oxidoreductase [Rickettsiales bacterium]